MQQVIYTPTETVPGAQFQVLADAEAFLVRTFDGGKTYELCIRVGGRWSVGVPVEVRHERD